MFKVHRQETLVYLVLWGLLFIAPVLSLYIRTTQGESFDWHEVLIVWRQYGIFFAIFLIHNHLLAPMLVYNHRRGLYLLGVACLVGVFTFYQCSIHPPMMDGDRPMHMDDRRPPMADDHHPRMAPPADHRPPMDAPQPPSSTTHHPSPNLPPHGEKPPRMFSQHDFFALIVLLLMLGANLGLKNYFRQRANQQSLAELEHRNLEQQLEYLKYQINPHFLMNTLNNIHALVDIDAEKAKQTIVELSKMLRFVLYEGNKALVPLDRELAFLQNYITLMRLRYTDKVRIAVDTPQDVPNCEVPPLLFITFVENAFKHGVSYRQESFIEVAITVAQAQTLQFTCRNSRIPSGEDKHGGVGLQNVQQRLDLIYGNRYKLDISDQPDTYTVNLTIPL